MSPRDPLDDMLDRWQPAADRVPDLRGRVRREIAAARGIESNSFRSRIDAVFGRPSFAITFVAACVLLGLFLAEARVSRLHAEYGAQIARSYVQLIDPLLDSANASATPTKATP